MADSPIWIDRPPEVTIKDGVVFLKEYSGKVEINMAMAVSTLQSFVDRSRVALAQWHADNA